MFLCVPQDTNEGARRSGRERRGTANTGHAPDAQGLSRVWTHA
ncbi:hypothetical protein [Mameliella sediminis]|nr:hypothetical protein [Mameliella sediminis]